MRPWATAVAGVQVAGGETPYTQFKKEFIDIGGGRRAEMEARAVIEQMDGQQDGAGSGSESERDVQHTVEVTEVCPPLLCSAASAPVAIAAYVGSPGAVGVHSWWC